MREVTCPLDGGALLDVLQNLRIAGFKADDEQPAARILHSLQRLAIGGDARGAGPCEIQRLQLLAEFNRASLLNVEGVVVKEELLDVRENLLRVRHLGCYVVCRALAPCVSAECLRPEAEGALRRASASGIKSHVGMQQERHVVARHIHIARIDIRDPWKLVEIVDLRAIRIVNYLAIFAIADAEQLVQRLAFREFLHGVIKFAAANEVDNGAFVQRLVRSSGNRGPNERDLDRWVRALDCFREPLIALPSNGAGEENEELEFLGDLDGFVSRDVMRRRVEQLGTLQHSGGIGQPDGVPVGFDFAGCGPAGTGATVKVLKGGRV